MSETHVRIRVGGEAYALPVENVREVAELGEVTPVPGAGRAVLGVRNLRGEVLPVFDLATVFGAERAGHGERLVVAEGVGRRAGFAIDAVTDVGTLPEAVQEAESDLLTGAALADGELVGIVDLEAVFVALEGEVRA